MAECPFEKGFTLIVGRYTRRFETVLRRRRGFEESRINRHHLLYGSPHRGRRQMNESGNTPRIRLQRLNDATNRAERRNPFAIENSE